MSVKRGPLWPWPQGARAVPRAGVAPTARSPERREPCSRSQAKGQSFVQGPVSASQHPLWGMDRCPWCPSTLGPAGGPQVSTGRPPDQVRGAVGDTAPPGPPSPLEREGGALVVTRTKCLREASCVPVYTQGQGCKALGSSRSKDGFHPPARPEGPRPPGLAQRQPPHTRPSPLLPGTAPSSESWPPPSEVTAGGGCP